MVQVNAENGGGAAVLRLLPHSPTPRRVIILNARSRPRYDPHATQFIAFNQISDFIASLDPPLGITKPNIVALVSFNLPIARGNKIHCLDILHALVKHVLGHVEETDEFKKVRRTPTPHADPSRKLFDTLRSCVP